MGFCAFVWLEKPAQQIENECQRERDQQHRYDGNVHANTATLVTDVARQAPKPVEPARIDQQADNNDENSTNDYE